MNDETLEQLRVAVKVCQENCEEMIVWSRKWQRRRNSASALMAGMWFLNTCVYLMAGDYWHAILSHTTGCLMATSMWVNLDCAVDHARRWKKIWAEQKRSAERLLRMFE